MAACSRRRRPSPTTFAARSRRQRSEGATAMRTTTAIRRAAPRRALTFASAMVFAGWLGASVSVPAHADDTAQWMAQVEAIVRKIADENVRMETYLGFFDQINRVQVARGSLPAADA